MATDFKKTCLKVWQDFKQVCSIVLQSTVFIPTLAMNFIHAFDEYYFLLRKRQTTTVESRGVASVTTRCASLEALMQLLYCCDGKVR
ncbi:hypothetical protein [Leptolyngbya sp. 7M]|uniref:hypothetical protein n=1 Tax=Leptolyngbya sp. 7M TaxID=2812896 RepID=UPI001B8CD407|nr:hypothetical protein [Leptolyngbya sp. 7M]QYO62276.1 hypothetical protein JVX88_19465 [Leptolyngbya sp. 7M]